jgi:hypothetical protein
MGITAFLHGWGGYADYTYARTRPRGMLWRNWPAAKRSRPRSARSTPSRTSRP